MNKIFLLLFLFINLHVSAASNPLRCSLLFVKNKINYLLTQPLAPNSLKNTEINLQEIAKIRDMPEEELKYESTITFSLGLIERIKKEKNLTLDTHKFLEDASFIKKWTTYLGFLISSKTKGKILSQDEVVMSLYKTMYLFQVKDQIDEWTFLNPYTSKIKVFWNDEKVGLYVKQVMEEQLMKNGLKSFNFFTDSTLKSKITDDRLRKYTDYFFQNTFNYISLYSYFTSHSPLFISLPYVKFDVLNAKVKEVLLNGAKEEDVNRLGELLEEMGLRSDLDKEIKKSVAINLVRDMFNKFMFGLMVYIIKEEAVNNQGQEEVKYKNVVSVLSKENLTTADSQFKSIFEAEFKRTPSVQDVQRIEDLLAEQAIEKNLDAISYSLVVNRLISSENKIEVSLQSQEFMTLFKDVFNRNANQDDVDAIREKLDVFEQK